MPSLHSKITRKQTIYTVDFLVPIIDNFWDLWFALELAIDLYLNNPNIQVRLWSENCELFTKMLGDITKYPSISYHSLCDFDIHNDDCSIITFFGYKISGQPKVLRRVWQCDYLQFWGTNGSPSEILLRSFDGTQYRDGNLEYIHRVPAISEYGAWIVHRKNTDTASLAVQQVNITNTRKHQATVFVYDHTFVKLIPVFHDFPNWEFIILGRENEWEQLPSNCTRSPFIPLTEMLTLYQWADLNIVRGENTLVTAIFAGKPWLWDIYRENNGAHESKLNDCLDTLENMDLLPLDKNTISEFIPYPEKSLKTILQWLQKESMSVQRQRATVATKIWFPNLTTEVIKWLTIV